MGKIGSRRVVATAGLLLAMCMVGLVAAAKDYVV
jgi:hypothetical protein